MNKLNPNDFLFGNTPDEAIECITNEYNSTVNLTSDQMKKYKDSANTDIDFSCYL